jgi:H/ACA ribonucleoprotein complex subunit 4
MEKHLSELLEFGIINVDKPSGPTSFNVSDFVRKKLGLRKTSHFGTLDPKVTGVLPVALNRACRLTRYFIGEDKEYVGIMRMHKEIELKKIESLIQKKFLGKIKQTPPVKSRVKRQEREREIKKFELLEQDGKDILFRVECEGGTYIRKLIDDLGKELKTGAHMLELLRTRAGIFKEENCVNLYELDKADEKKLREIIIPAEKAMQEVFPSVLIKSKNLNNLFTGKPIRKSDLTKEYKFEKGQIFSAFCGRRFV